MIFLRYIKNMEKLQLNKKKVDLELRRLNKTYTWLAQEIGISKALLSYHVILKTIKAAEMIAPVFKLHAKDLIK